MKKITLFLLPVCLLLTITSCNMEKRLYRNGWYTERSNHATNASKQEISSAVIAENEIQPKEIISSGDIVPPAEIKPDRVAANSPSLQKKLEELQEKKAQLEGDPIVKMTYAQARASMAKQGCEPHEAAMTVYYMSLASVISCLIGFGFLLSIITLIVSVFAINRVTEGGSCMEENLAIIRAARRICLGILLGFLIAAMIVLSIVLLVIGTAITTGQ